jgi:sporulation protein YlmC with PRC-barrel domain
LDGRYDEKDQGMPKHIQKTTYAVALGLGLLTAAGLSAQAQTTATTPATANSNSDKAPNGSLEKYHGTLRASELTGAKVYNDEGTSVGTIDDLLVGDDGKIQNVVLSVGGLLGVGTHYVSVPFAQLQIQPSRPGTTASTDTNTTNSSVAPANSTGSTGTGMAANASPAQYFSVVLPGATKDSLTKMPEFSYRS